VKSEQYCRVVLLLPIFNRCDPIVLGLHEGVKKHREAIRIASVDASLLASCPSLEAAKTEEEANAAFNCLLRNSGQTSAMLKLAECLRSSPVDTCATTHAALARTVGIWYGKSKLSASLI
jgi:hypothetical protein